MTPKVLIEIKGGNMTFIAANTEIEYVVIDHDNMDADDENGNVHVLELGNPDVVDENMNKYYADLPHIQNELIRLGY